MRRRSFAAALLLGCSSAGLLAQAPEADPLGPIRAEEDLEKRSKLALEYARNSIGKVAAAYEDADRETARAILASILEAAQLSEESLDDTGKVARKKPKHFKRAEIGTRKLLGDLKDLDRTLTFDEREDLKPIIERLEEINNRLLQRIMRKR